MKQVPYSHQWIDDNDVKSVVEVLRSDWITRGPKVKEFENAICRYTGAKYAVVVSSGTAALHIACLAIGIKSGDEVITSPITFVASANCVLYCCGKPVFADIQKDTVNINPEEIKKKINKRTKAVIPVHFAGQPCDMLQIHRIAKKYNLFVIEDASHALGAEYKGKKIGDGKYSDITIFSFHPVKSITTGEGGAVLTNNKDYYEKLLMFRQSGVTKESAIFKNKSNDFGEWYYEMQLLGYNYRLTDIQCALGISQLKRIDKFIQRRREIVEIYKKAFKDNEYFNLPEEKNYAKSSWHLYPIRIKDKGSRIKKSGLSIKRNKIFDALRRNGIGVQVHYIPVYWQPYYQELGHKKGVCPNAEDFYQREISIPLYQSMSTEEINLVIDKTFRVFKEV